MQPRRYLLFRPRHHEVVEYLDAYLKLTERRMTRGEAFDMIKRRARQAGLSDNVSPHTGRASGKLAASSSMDARGLHQFGIPPSWFATTWYEDGAVMPLFDSIDTSTIAGLRRPRSSPTRRE